MNILKAKSIFLFILVAVLSITACTPAEKTITVGIVTPAGSMEPVIQGFKDGMAERGYIEGENITYIYSGPLGADTAVLEAEVQRFVDEKVDLVLALATPGALAAKKIVAGTDIPVVYAPISDPVGAGLAESILAPGNNMTGIKSGGFVAKELEWLMRVAPETQKIFAPYNPNDNGAVSGWQQLNETAQTFGVELVTPEVTTPDEIPNVLASMPADIDALFMLTDSMILSRVADFVAVSLEKQLPLTSINIAQVEAGALMSYGPEFVSVGVQAARLADQILKGTEAGVLPVEEAEYQLFLNQKSADAIGITFPDEAIIAAEEIIR